MNAPDKGAFIINAIDEYTASDTYRKAREADAYFAGNNPALLGLKSELSVDGHKIDLTAAIRTPTGIFKRLIIQLVQSVWFYGVSLETPEMKKRLGADFDYVASAISENAALHGVAYGFWNLDRLVMFTALEYFPFKDERTAQDMAGVRFWRLDGGKPWVVQLFEADGWTEYRRLDNADTLELVMPKQAYKQSIRRDAIETKIVSGANYGVLPVLPMYANKRRESELTKPIKTKIDAFDAISTGFWETIMRTRNIYWTLQGFSGQADDLRALLNEIGRLGIVAPTDESSAAPHTVDLPFAAVQYALDKLEEEIYLDFMGMRLSEITGGSLTNVAIQTAAYNLALKTSDFEWQAFDFVHRLLRLLDIDTENIKFKKKSVTNDYEITRQLILMAPYLDSYTILEKAPMLEPDEPSVISQRKAIESLERSEPAVQDELIGGLTDSQTQAAAAKKLSGIHTSALVGVIEKYSAGALTLQQAINIVSVSIGVSREEAKQIIEGLE